MAGENSDELDDILDQALDDLEQIDAVQVEESTVDDAVPLSPAAPSSGLAMNPQELNDNMDEEDAKLLNEFMKQMQSAVDDMGSKSKKSTASTTKKKKSKSRPTVEPKPQGDDVEATLASILQQMTTMDPDDLDDDFLAGMGGLNPDAIVDGMMQQLLSKELMYEPMKHVADHFPRWLEEKKNSLSPTELDKFRRQHECFRELVEQYENDPNDTERLVTLMQDAQEFGQPPDDIIKAIAPGLELDSEGIPKGNPFEGFGGSNGDCPQM